MKKCTFIIFTAILVNTVTGAEFAAENLIGKWKGVPKEGAKPTKEDHTFTATKWIMVTSAETMTRDIVLLDNRAVPEKKIKGAFSGTDRASFEVQFGDDYKTAVITINYIDRDPLKYEITKVSPDDVEAKKLNEELKQAMASGKLKKK